MERVEAGVQGENATLPTDGGEIGGKRKVVRKDVAKRNKARGFAATMGEAAYECMINRIIDLRSEGWSMMAVSREITNKGFQLPSGEFRPTKISDVEVYRIEMRWATKEYDKLFIKREELRRQAVMRIDKQIKELYEAWHRSKTPFGEKTVDQTEEVPEEPTNIENLHLDPKHLALVCTKKKTKTRAHARDGSVSYQSEITKLSRLRAEILGLIAPEAATMVGEQNVYYCPVPPGDPKAKASRPFEFDKPKIVPNLAADEIPVDLLPRENMAQEATEEDLLYGEIPPVSGGQFQ